MTRIVAALFILPVAWYTFAFVSGEEKTSNTKPVVKIETIKFENVDVISIQTKGTRVLARSLTLENGCTVKPHSGEVEVVTGLSRVRTKRLEISAKIELESKQIDIVRIEIEPLQD